MKMDISAAFLTIMFVLVVGDILSAKTKALIPSIFVSAVLFLVGFWTFFPAKIGEIAGLGKTMGALSTYLLVVNMGTSIKLRQLKQQWKTILLALLAMAGLAIGIMTIGKQFIGYQAAVVSTPCLAGGIIAALIMQEGALAKGLTSMATLAILVFVTQGFFGYPLTAMCIRKEGERLLKDYRKQDASKIASQKEASATVERTLIPPIPAKYLSDNMHLFSLAILAWLAVAISGLTNGAIPKTIMCLFMGVIGGELGLAQVKPLQKSSSSGFIMVAQLTYVFAGLADATPQMVANMIVPLMLVVATGVLGLAIVSMILGPKMGYSKYMSFAIGLNALLGFPPNYIITNDVSTALAKTPEEKEFLMDKMLPDMLIAGFATVTIGSVVLAGFFVKLL